MIDGPSHSNESMYFPSNAVFDQRIFLVSSSESGSFKKALSSSVVHRVRQNKLSTLAHQNESYTSPILKIYGNVIFEWQKTRHFESQKLQN